LQVLRCQLGDNAPGAHLSSAETPQALTSR
jgi:hypothetical protein